MQRLSSCGSGVVWCRTGNYSQADECVNFGRKSFEFSERLEGKKREKRRKMAGGGTPQNWTSDRPRSVRPDWLSSCGFVELFLRNVNPLSKHGLWLRLPTHHGHKQRSRNTGSLSDYASWSTVDGVQQLEGENRTCSSQCQQFAFDLYFSGRRGSRERILVRKPQKLFVFLKAFILLCFSSM